MTIYLGNIIRRQIMKKIIVSTLAAVWFIALLTAGCSNANPTGPTNGESFLGTSITPTPVFILTPVPTLAPTPAVKQNPVSESMK